MVTENEIKILGFEKCLLDVGDEYFYSYDIANGLSLITNTNLESENGGWYVEIFNVDPSIRFSNFSEIQIFINSITSKKMTTH